ncbi:hypothetical protein VPH35_008220 [Triticum aestivum]|uniref:uncharacterized protein isoform X1 n=1 Tax=Triticum aestivum TaxID=4565 RepID=UPI001D012531|nr:uncharacterized protein LOC123122173 isoform X1 [Triticum aestivum]
MNSEETTEEGSVELALENHEELRSRVSDVRPRSTEINSEQTTEERSMEHYCPNSVLQATSYPDADGNIISQVQPDVVTPRGGSNVVRVEPNYGIIGVRVSLGGVQAYIIPVQAAAHLRHSTFGTGSGHINETMSAEASPDFSVRDAVGVELNSDDVRAYIQAQQVAAHFRRSIFGAGSGHINETMSAEASPDFSVRDAVGVELNSDDVRAYIQAQQVAAHFRRSIFGAGSGHINETMSAEASPDFSVRDAVGVELNSDDVRAYIQAQQVAAHFRRSIFGAGSGHINETMSAEASPDFSVRDAVGVELNSDDVRAYIQAQQVAAHFRRSIFGAGSGHINETMSAEASPDFSVRDAVGVELNSDDVRAYIQVAAHFRRSIFGAGSGHINETMSAEASPDFSVRDAVGVELNSDDVRAYIQAQQVAAHFRRSIFGAGSGHINETMSAEASPGFSVRDDVGVELNDDDVRAYIRAQQAAAHFRRSIFGAGFGHINETMSAEASPGFSVRDDVGVELNDDDVQAYIQAQQAAAHFRRSTFGAGSGYITETMSVEASSPGGGDGRLGVEWNDEMLTALRSSAPAMREHDGSQDFLVDEAGGRFLAIHIHPPQQGDQGLVGAARGTQDGPGDLARHALPSVIGGLVPLCFNLLLDDSILKADSSPGYIKAAAAAGLGLVTAFTFLGVASKKRAKAAARVVASASTAAVSIAMVYQVSDNAYIKCVCGIMGCVATLATMAIDW